MASKKFFVDVDLHKNQLLNAVLQSGGTAALGGLLDVAGQVGYNSDLKRVAYFDGVENQTLLAGAETFADHITDTGAAAKAASVKAIYDYYNSTDATSGATVIGINDVGNYFDETTVNGALQEIGAVLNDISKAMHLQDTIAATNGAVAYPTTGSGTDDSVQQGDAYLVTGAIDATGTTAGSYILLGDNSIWVGAGSLIVAAVDAPATDADWYILDARRKPSSETVRGIIAIATQAEVNAGEDNTKAVTALKLKAFVESISGTTMYVETVAAGSKTATVTHNLGSDVAVQVWLGGTEDITSGVALTSGAGTVAYSSNVNMPDTLKFVCIGKTSAYWA